MAREKVKRIDEESYQKGLEVARLIINIEKDIFFEMVNNMKKIKHMKKREYEIYLKWILSTSISRVLAGSAFKAGLGEKNNVLPKHERREV